MDPECSVCNAIVDAIESLQKICRHIDFSCLGMSKADQLKKSDFGLDKFFIEKQIEAIVKMQEWHMYYHATGKSLKDSNSVVESKLRPFKRFRPG